MITVDESGQNTFSEIYDLTYDKLGRLTNMDYDSGRTMITLMTVGMENLIRLISRIWENT